MKGHGAKVKRHGTKVKGRETLMKRPPMHFIGAGTHNGRALHHVVPIVVAVCTEVHAAGHTRKWPLLPIADAALCSFLL